MNSQPNPTEHGPEPTAHRSETERRGIIGSTPATADQNRKESSQPNDQRADLHSLNGMIVRLVEGDIIGVFMWDLEGRIYEANEMFLRMVGYSREDLAAGRLNWRNLTPPEWREADERHLQDVRKTGRVPPFEKEYFRNDGSRVPILLGAVSFDEDQSQGVSFVLDLTERKQAEEALRRSEQELRDLVENMPAMAGVLLPDGSHPYLTNQWRDYSGLSVGETDSEGWRRAVHPEDINLQLKNSAPLRRPGSDSRTR